MQYLTSKISKLQSPGRMFSTVYVLNLEKLSVQKILYFCGFWQTPTFQIIYKHPLSRSFLDHRVILWGWTSHIIKYSWSGTKSYVRRLILSSKIVSFSSNVFFPAFTFCLFLLKCSDANLCSLWLIIFWSIKMMSWKRQNSRSCIFVKS